MSDFVCPYVVVATGMKCGRSFAKKAYLHEHMLSRHLAVPDDSNKGWSLLDPNSKETEERWLTLAR